MIQNGHICSQSSSTSTLASRCYARSVRIFLFFFLVPFFYKVSVLDCCTGLIYWSVSAMRAAVTAWRKGSGLWRALALASWRMNPAASSLQRPPASTPKTTKRQRPGWTSSGHVRYLDLRTIPLQIRCFQKQVVHGQRQTSAPLLQNICLFGFGAHRRAVGACAA